MTILFPLDHFFQLDNISSEHLGFFEMPGISSLKIYCVVVVNCFDAVMNNLVPLLLIRSIESSVFHLSSFGLDLFVSWVD